MSYLVGNPEDRFSLDMAQMVNGMCTSDPGQTAISLGLDCSLRYVEILEQVPGGVRIPPAGAIS